MTALSLPLYRLLTGLLLILAAPYWIYRWVRHPGEMRERFGLSSGAAGQPHRGDSIEGVESGDSIEGVESGDCVWIHAASLGEVEAVRAWLQTQPFARALRIVLTVTSTSARRRAAERVGDGVSVRFVPLDFDFAVRPFLNQTRPRLLVVVETEIWPILLDNCRRRGLPVVMISARISDRAWPRTVRFRWLFAAVAPAVSAVAAQTEKDAERFRGLGFDPVEVCGNVKYELADSESELGVAGGPDGPRPPDPSGRPKGQGLRDPGSFLWVVGSLRKGEEAMVGAVSRAREAGLAVVLAPRHLRERDHWTRVVREAGLEPVLRGDLPGPVDWAHPLEWMRGRVEPGRVLVVDVHGELRSWYEHAQAASVGGTWVPIGGHSLFEPASLGVPVSFGPYTANVEDVAAALIEEGGGERITQPEETWAWVERLLDPAFGQKTERSALRAARRLASAGKRTRAYLFERLGSKEGGGIFRP